MTVPETALALSRTWGAWLPFVGLAVETAGLPLPLPGEVWLLLAGVLTAAGFLSVPVALGMGALAAMAGDQVGFLVGRRLGRCVVERQCLRIPYGARTVAIASAGIRRYGARVVVLARFLPWIRTVIVILGGASGMPYRRFLLADLVGAALWSTTYLLLGFSLDPAWLGAGRLPVGKGAGIALLVAGVGLSAMAVYRSRGWWAALLRALPQRWSRTWSGRTARALLLVPAVLGIPATAAAAEVRTVSFADATRLALERNPQVAAARKGIFVAEGDVGIAKSERWPRVDASASYTRYGDPVQVVPLSRPGVFGRFDRNIYDAGLTFSVPLYAGGRIVRGIQIAEADRTIAERGVGQVEVDLVFNVAATFSKILQLRKLEEADRAAVTQLEEHRRVSALLITAGKAPRVDLLKADVRLAEVRQSLVKTQANLESAQSLLARLLGFNPTSIRVDAAGELEYRPVRQNVEAAVETAYRQRPDYLAQKTAVDQAALRTARARGKRLPTLSANGQYGGRSGDNFGVEEQWNLGVFLSFPIFDGWAISSEISREQAKMSAAEDRLRDLELTIASEVKDAFLDLGQAEERLTLARASLDQAREALRVEQIRYEAGMGTSADVLDAHAALLGAESLLAQALYDHAVARAGLDRAAGNLLAAPAAAGPTNMDAADRNAIGTVAGRGR